MSLLALAAAITSCARGGNDDARASRPDPAAVPAFDAEAVVSEWVGLWRTYDLDLVDDLFLQDERVTYFSSEFEGLIRGSAELLEHHRGFGFVPGGIEPEQELWVEDVEAMVHGEAVVVGAQWYFGDRAARDEAGRGPMTVVYVWDGDRYRIAHMHFANYESA